MRLAALLVVMLTVAFSCTVASHDAASHARTQPSTPQSVGPLTTGGVVEHSVPDPGTYPQDCPVPCRPNLGTITLGADGNIWYVDLNRHLVGRITPQGQFAQFAVPSPSGGEHTIVTGPDGNIWLTARGGQDEPDWIVRVTREGVVTKFPTRPDAPESITAGPDGNLWFTEVAGNRIGRMTPAGALIEFEIPAMGGGPLRGITTGPDGALWFTDSTAIGRLTTRGELSWNLIANFVSRPPLGDIVSGPDGDLWFTSGEQLGHLAIRTGKVTDVPLPKTSRPRNLIVGPDRNIWFTDEGRNSVDRLSLTGAIREFTMPRRSSGPLGIAVGSDGRIWFTEAVTGIVASIGAKVPEAAIGAHALVFGDASPKSLTITNTGDGVLAIESLRLQGVDAEDFAILSNQCGGRSLNPGASCDVRLASHVGGSTGVRSGLLEMVDNATGSPQQVSLVAQLRPCKLPVVVFSPDDATPRGEVFDTMSGSLLEESGGGFESVGPASGVRTAAQPVLYGPTPGYYDRAFARWLPVYSPYLISPDGSQYAYTVVDSYSPQAHLHVVDVASGRDRELSLPTGFWVIVAFTKQGIYLHPAYEGVGPGLWRVDPGSGAVQKVLQDETVLAVSGTTAWIGSRNSADTLPQPPGIGGGYNQIVSRDLTTGSTTSWYYGPGTMDAVVAVVNGSPIVSAYDGAASRLFYVGSPNQPQPMDFPFADPFPNFSGFVASPDGIWVGGPDGIYLWSARTDGVLVSDAQAAEPAGTCA